jgi:dTDP-glucose 4,6-dehydratase
MNILVTGGLGFIGSNFINQRLADHKDQIYNVDKETYAARHDNIHEFDTYIYGGMPEPAYRHYKCDINDTDQIIRIYEAKNIEAIVHFAAESHVDRSIDSSDEFIKSNINGTHSLLEAFKKCSRPSDKFIHVSTDEVYGDLTESDPAFTESSPIKPSSPYAASKAASDLLCHSYFRTHKLPICITRCSNNYGPNQFPEKLIPLMIQKALDGEKLPVYGDGMNIRDWIHVYDHCSAISTVLDRGQPGEVYNIGGECELRNITLVRSILDELNVPHDMIEYVQDRKGHDWRYAMDNTKISSELGWNPVVGFQQGLQSLIQSYK